MTIPATLSITTASIGLLAALLAFGLSSAPGWRELRWFALSAICATLVSVSNALLTLDVGETTLFLASRLQLMVGGFYVACWIKFTAAHEDRELSAIERVGAQLGIGFGALAAIPGALVQQRLVVHGPSLGATHVDAPPSLLGLLGLLCFVLTVLALLVRAVRRRISGDVDMTAHAIALAAVLVGALHDSLAKMGLVRPPYLLDLTLLVLVLAVGGSITSRFVSSARALEASSLELAAAHAELLKRERLAALGELSAMVAHEVRNPLAVVFNATAGLRRAQPGSTDHAALVSIVQEEAERLRDIVSDLLEFARPRPPVLGAVNFEELVRGAVEAGRAVVGAAEGDAVVEVSGEPGRMTCDDRLVRQAVVNLITNALQASGRRSPVRVVLSDDPSRRAVTVLVIDDGNGVREDLREQIFTPFFSTRPKGTGLGLNVVRRCAEAHGGEVGIEPTPGGGATFELRLPRGEG